MGKHDAINALIRRPRPEFRMISDGRGHARFERIEAEPAGDDTIEPPEGRVVEGTADGGKGREEPEPPRSGANSAMNRIIRREAFIDEARRIRQGAR